MQATARSQSWFWAGEEPEWIVVATLIVVLLLGWALMLGVTGQTSSTTLGAASLRYPADWGQSGEDGPWSAAELGTQTRVSLSILRELNPAAPVALDELVAKRGFDQANAHALYRVLSSGQAKVGGKPGVAVTYAYVLDPSTSLHASALPIVVQGTDYIVPHSGKVYLISLESDVRTLDERKGALERILRSVRFN